MKTYILISVIMMSLLLSGCSDDEVIDIVKDCGPYSEPVKVHESEVVESKFQEDRSIETIYGSSGNAYDFIKNDGDSLVFHFIRFYHEDVPATHAYYEFHLLFQVPKSTTSLYISSTEFRNYNVFFRSYNYGNENGYLSDETGCIELIKIASDQYKVNINITYINYPGKNSDIQSEVKSISFTDTFNIGSSHHDTRMHFGDN